MSIYLNHYLEMRNNQNTEEKLPSLEEIKRNYIHYILKVTDNNLDETAEILDVSRTALQKKIKE
jgi:transcriptional regulator with PAS, ATPase and Fis domain